MMYTQNVLSQRKDIRQTVSGEKIIQQNTFIRLSRFYRTRLAQSRILSQRDAIPYAKDLDVKLLSSLANHLQ